MNCSTCLAPLEPMDGHIECPRCLGVEHLREALTENQCMNCSYMPRDLKVARLAEVEAHINSQLSPSGVKARPWN